MHLVTAGDCPQEGVHSRQTQKLSKRDLQVRLEFVTRDAREHRRLFGVDTERAGFGGILDLETDLSDLSFNSRDETMQLTFLFPPTSCTIAHN